MSVDERGLGEGKGGSCLALVFLSWNSVSQLALWAWAAMDLFSFLDEQPTNDIDADGDVEIESADAPTAPRKRRASTPPTHANDPNHAPATNGEPSTKRARPTIPLPVVLDEFETEAKREVAASAGLAGPVEAGSRLELKHQVCLHCHIAEVSIS